MNLPNQLTVTRIVFSFIFMAVLFSPLPFAHTLAFAVFFAASVTDMLDGKIARSRGLESDFGRLMDPLADKILISTAFISFVQMRATGVAAWMVVLIISREFLITGLRLLALSKGSLVKAGIWGKHKAVTQVVAIYLILIFLAVKEFLVKDPQLWDRWQTSYNSIGQTVIFWTMLMVVALTLLSGYFYLKENRRVFMLEGKE